MNYLEKCFDKDPNIVARKIADEVILVPVVSSTADMDCIYTLNEMSAYIWELIDGKNKLKNIKDRTIQDFDVGPKEAQADLIEFIEQLLEIKAIKEV